VVGILDPQCSTFFFPMQCDIYYASESQDELGMIDKKWNLDKTVPCSFYTLNDESNRNNFGFDTKKDYRLETMLFGRVKSDIRKNSFGQHFPLSHILVTNIRSATCSDDLFFYETNADYVSVPTIFEVKMAQPYIGPFTTIEYFKIQLERSDTQELNEHASC
jgi:hypothetical protein